MKQIKQLTIALLIGLFAILVGCGGSEDVAIDGTIQVEQAADIIKMGFIAPLTGDVASIGQSAKNTAQLAVEEINAAGGINGKQIEMIYEDGQCDGKTATSAATKLIGVDKVNYVVGGLCSPELIAAAPLAESAGVVMLSPCASNPGITDAGDYIFRDYPSDSFQGKYAAEYAYNDLGAREVAIMACLNDWCAGLKEVFTETFEGLGGEIVEVQEFERGSTDLRTQLTKVKDASPDMVYMPAMTEETIAAMKQKSELGMQDLLFLGGDGWGDHTIWENTVGFADGTQFVVPKVDVPASFEASFAKRYGADEAITLCAPQAYDAVYIYAQTISKVGDNAEAVKNELYNVQGFQGVSGTISFDENGDLKGAAYVINEIRNGKPVEIN